MKTLLLSVLIPWLIILNLFATEDKPRPGFLMLEVKPGFVEFPLEIGGIVVSYQNNDMRIDSILYVQFKPNSRQIRHIEKINFQTFQRTNPGIAKKLKINFPAELIRVFKKYQVYKIEKSFKTFAPRDTLSHSIKRRGKEVNIKLPNFNKYVWIYFDKKFDPETVAKELLKLPYIKNAQPDYPIKFFEGPNDSGYQNGYQ